MKGFKPGLKIKSHTFGSTIQNHFGEPMDCEYEQFHKGAYYIWPSRGLNFKPTKKSLMF